MKFLIFTLMLLAAPLLALYMFATTLIGVGIHALYYLTEKK